MTAGERSIIETALFLLLDGRRTNTVSLQEVVFEALGKASQEVSRVRFAREVLKEHFDHEGDDFWLRP